VIKSPWVDPQNGQILPYNLEEDAKLVQSVSGDLWTLVEAMVESTSAKAEHARMKRFVVDTAAAVAAGLQTHLFHPYSKMVREAWTIEKVVCKLADLRKRKLINVLTILGELVGMNQNRQSNPSQLVVYRQFVSTSGGASTRFASDIGSFGGRAPGRTFMLDLAQVSAKTYLNTFGARVCELYAESSEVSRGEAGHEEPRAADESGIPSGVPHEALYRDLYAKFDVTYRRAKSLVTLIDNFVVRVATYKTQLGARDNANIVTTEQGLVTMMRINFLRDRADRDPNLPPVGIKNVEHRHYLLASGLTWPAARMKKSVGRLLSRRVEEGQQEDVILKRTEKPVWAASNAKLDAWLLGDFIAILEGVKAGNDWSADTGRLGDAMWPRAATVQRQTLTQPRLESVCLPEMVKYLERVRADGPEVATAAAGGGLGGGATAAAAAPVDSLAAFFALRSTTVDALKGECRRRGLAVSAPTKAELVARVTTHALSAAVRSGGYINMDAKDTDGATGKAIADWRPRDFTGKAPPVNSTHAAVP
jgi:hypothetical protein